MDYRTDAKGKHYTERVNKQVIHVVIATATHLIRGVTYVMPEHRFKDELNDAEHFIAITDAQVFDPSGQTQLHSSPVLLLNKQYIVWTMPLDSPPSGEEMSHDDASKVERGEDRVG